MAEFVKVAEVGQLPPGEVLLLLAGDVVAVMVNVEGDYYAIPPLLHPRGGL